MKNREVANTTWVTSARPNDLIRVGDVFVRVKTVSGGQAVLVFSLPANVRIKKLVGSHD